MKAWVLRDFGNLALEEWPVPEGSGLLLRVVATGICGSDLGALKGTPLMRARWHPPLVLGHEVAGVVEAGPPELLGKAVALHPAPPCGLCPSCRQRKPHLCERRVHLGFHRPGGLAERILVPPEAAYPLPEGLPPWKGALAEPLAVALHGAALAGAEKGEEVLVLGGAIGSLVAFTLGLRGARVHIAEANPRRAAVLARLALGKVAGAPEAFGKTFPLVLDTVGQEASLKAALDACAPGGRVTVLGLGAVESPLPLARLVLEEKRVQGSYLFTPEEFAEAVALLPRLPEGLVRLWPMTQADKAFHSLLAGEVSEPKLVLVW
jgi:threonine dehydrogenase-like Zn-dependent dehydrogenase